MPIAIVILTGCAYIGRCCHVKQKKSVDCPLTSPPQGRIVLYMNNANTTHNESKAVFKKMIVAAKRSMRESGGDTSAAHARAAEQAPGMARALCMDLAWQAVLIAR